MFRNIPKHNGHVAMYFQDIRCVHSCVCESIAKMQEIIHCGSSQLGPEKKTALSKIMKSSYLTKVRGKAKLSW